MMDAVSVVGEVVRRMGGGRPDFLPSGVSCDNDRTWRNGSNFKNELRMLQHNGLTGPIQVATSICEPER